MCTTAELLGEIANGAMSPEGKGNGRCIPLYPGQSPDNTNGLTLEDLFRSIFWNINVLIESEFKFGKKSFLPVHPLIIKKPEGN